MEILKTLLFKKRLRPKYRLNTLTEIRKILTEYSRKHITIVECISNTGPLTAELVYIFSSKKPNKNVFDTILIMITTYYVMLYMDMYTGFYTVSRKHTCNMVSSMVEEVLKETAKKQKGIKLNNPYTAIRKSQEFTNQMVDIYYRTGIEDCHRYVASSVYLTLLSENKNQSVKRERVERIIRVIKAEKFLTGYNENEDFSIENTG